MIEAEEMLWLAGAGDHFPLPVSRVTARRYATRGVSGVVLETVRIGGRIATSKEAIGRFVEACSRHQVREAGISVATGKRKQEKVRRELDAILGRKS